MVLYSGAKPGCRTEGQNEGCFQWGSDRNTEKNILLIF